MLHTSSKYDVYHLERNINGKIEKLPREEDRPTADENAVKTSRLLRKYQEMAHGNLKGQFQIMNPGKLSSYYLQPIPAATLLRCGLSEEYRNVPKLSYIVVVCLSLLNDLHPGYRPAMSDADQRALAENLMKRLCLENPLHHNIWPVDFDGPRSTCRGDWSQTQLEHCGLWPISGFHD